MSSKVVEFNCLNAALSTSRFWNVGLVQVSVLQSFLNKCVVDYDYLQMIDLVSNKA